MTKKEKEKIIDVLDLWLDNANKMTDSFLKDKRENLKKEIEIRLDKIYFLADFLHSCRFITDTEYLRYLDKHLELRNVIDC